MNSDNLETLSHDKTDKVIKNSFESLLPRYQIGLETSIKSSNSILDCLCSIIVSKMP